MDSSVEFSFSSSTTNRNAVDVASSDDFYDFLAEVKPSRCDSTDLFLLSNDEINDVFSEWRDGQAETTIIPGTSYELVEPAPSSFKDNTANNERIIKDSNQSNISTGNNPEYIDFFCERNEDLDQIETDLLDAEFESIHLVETNTVNNQWDMMDQMRNDTIQLNNVEINDSIDQQIDEGIVYVPSQQLTEELPRVSTDSSEQITFDDLNKTRVDTLVKADSNADSGLINSIYGEQTNQTLVFRSQPLPFQRVIYECDLEEDLRFVSTQDDNYIKFEMFNLLLNFIPKKILLRVTRIATPFGPNNLLLCHPYLLWTTDKDAKVHHGSLLLDVTNSIKNNQPISFKSLIIGRLRQRILKKIPQWRIYTPNQLDCNEFHIINTKKPRDIIKNYNLRYSILVFQIFLVDDNQVTYPTDLICQSESLFEFEHKDRSKLPDFLPPKRKRPSKRLQQNSCTTRKHRSSKKLKWPVGPHPPPL